MKKNYLFIGGPKNGETMAVEEGLESLKVPVPMGAAMDTKTGVPIIGATATYVLRKIGIQIGRKGYTKRLFVDMTMSSDQAMGALTQLLVIMFMRAEADEVVDL